MDLTARLEMRGVDWSTTKAFMVPSGDCGYIRLNLRGRERDGIVDAKDADALLEQIASGLRTFYDPDGAPAIAKVELAAESLGYRDQSHRFPDLIVHWSESLGSHNTRVIKNTDCDEAATYTGHWPYGLCCTRGRQRRVNG